MAKKINFASESRKYECRDAIKNFKKSCSGYQKAGKIRHSAQKIRQK
jgi:hypothetical protein